MAPALPMIQRVGVLRFALTIVSATAAPHRASGQRGMELTAHPGIVYPFRLESAWLGGRLSFWVSRTETVGVGGEVGTFIGGSREREIQTDDPVFRPVTLTERREGGLGFVRGLVRYRLSRVASLESFGVLGTGLYALRERTESSERSPRGELVRGGARTYESYSLHPGASAGWALGWRLSRDWVLLSDLCLHFVIGAEGVFYPMLVGSIGVGKRL